MPTGGQPYNADNGHTQVYARAIGADGLTAASATNPPPGASSGCFASASFMPAAGAYGAGDIMGTTPALEFAWTDCNGIAIPTGALIRVLSTVMKIDQTAVQSGETSYTLHAYSLTPPSAQADNAAWSLASADLSAYRGPLALGTPLDLGAACYVKSQVVDPVTSQPGIDLRLATGSSSVWGELVTTAAFTATAVARQVILYGIVL